jgi:hypothetical protein
VKNKKNHGAKKNQFNAPLTIFHRSVNGFEKTTLLRVHTSSFCWSDGKEGCIKGSDVITDEMSVSYVGLQFPSDSKQQGGMQFNKPSPIFRHQDGKKPQGCNDQAEFLSTPTFQTTKNCRSFLECLHHWGI